MTPEQLISRIPPDDFVTDVDGYVYFWATGRGGYSAWMLRTIADYLDARNAEWDAIVQSDPLISPTQTQESGQ